MVSYRRSVVGPGGPLHLAVLDVEGEVFDGDLARRPKDAVRQPHHLARVAHDHVRVDHRQVVVRVSAEEREIALYIAFITSQGNVLN